MPHSRLVHILTLLALLLPLLAIGAEPGRAAEEIYFPETGQTLSDEHGFLTYWRTYGGLAQFGYPLSEVITETLEDGKRYQVQYFERARFERHPENGLPYTILLGQFGRRILAGR